MSDGDATAGGSGEDLRSRAMREHPDFPWLELERPGSVRSYLERAGWLEPGERFRGCERAGEGNMNLTLRVRTDRRRFVLKQARPWVEKYDHIPAPWDRALSEQRFYRRVQSLREVASRMPRLLGCDPEARVLLLEDLPGARDMSDLYAAVGAPEGREPRLSAVEIDELGTYLCGLHAGTFGEPDPELANRGMRRLNHEHVFRVPLDPENGLELGGFEPGLDARARELCRDEAARTAMESLGQRYLADGPCLVHGDAFPGSWLRCELGVRVIDPEFAFFGEPEVDVGCALGHLALAGQPAQPARDLLQAYAKGPQAPELERTLLARYAAAEVIRRLVGVAQLPIAPTRGFRGALLARARQALVEGRLEELWS